MAGSNGIERWQQWPRYLQRQRLKLRPQPVEFVFCNNVSPLTNTNICSTKSVNPTQQTRIKQQLNITFWFKKLTISNLSLLILKCHPPYLSSSSTVTLSWASTSRSLSLINNFLTWDSSCCSRFLSIGNLIVILRLGITWHSLPI